MTAPFDSPREHTLALPAKSVARKARFVVRVGRIELPSRPWQGRILPLNHTRNIDLSIENCCFLVGVQGFEP